MPTYIALLRGINVSGHKTVPMADLQKLFEKLGFKGAKTFIQSGNVAFKSAGGGDAALAEKLEAAIAERFGFEVTVIVRKAEEMSAALAGNPYARKKLVENERVYITFLGAAPSKDAVKALEGFADPVDELKVRKTEVYVLARNGYGNSKLSNAFVEKKLGVRATTRNLETTAKLIELAGSL
ncbi:MAG TPA: DUF1697 domain-containing protein [Fibrobacteria bacterium]|nr:DUF1697 domain-containing protein [Fibrobacteria bacterium]